jgi:copper chaperone for superoxide dismutase
MIFLIIENKMSSNLTKLEFEVKDLEQRNSEQIRESLMKRHGIHNAVVDAEQNKIFVETNLPSSVILNQIERESQSIAVLRGMGTSGWTNEKRQTCAAVSIISNFDERPKPIRGVVRFVQIDDNNCAIGGTIDGLSPGSHALNVCEFGDISRGCESTGNVFNPFNMKHGLPPSPERVI